MSKKTFYRCEYLFVCILTSDIFQVSILLSPICVHRFNVVQLNLNIFVYSISHFALL